MASVQIEKVCKNFGKTAVLHDVSVDIGHGEFVVLVGPSGCGKSTLLRTVAGLETLTSGDIRIGDRTVKHLAPKDRDIAMVFQNYALYPQMTVAQNMVFSLELAGVGKAERACKLQQVAKILDLESLLGRLPRQLSGGQRQRVAMGRAIIRDPQVFLFDEPLSNLDATLRVQMRAEIKALQRRLGTTALYVTHDQIEAMTMADKIVVMRAGRVEQAGAPLALYDQPINRFVASFIGSPAMNFLDGLVDADGSALRLSDRHGNPAQAVRIPLVAAPRAAWGKAVTLGVRPEHIRLDSQGVPATVIVIEPTGSETHLVAQIAGQSLTVIVKARLSVGPGEMVRLHLGDVQYFFDPDTTLCLNPT